jgi:hypothetical protein
MRTRLLPAAPAAAEGLDTGLKAQHLSCGCCTGCTRGDCPASVTADAGRASAAACAAICPAERVSRSRLADLAWW